MTTTGRDPFAAYAAMAAPPQGQFLKFSKGEWIFGQDKLELALGSRFAANMDGFQVGWLRWWNGEVSERKMNLLIDMIPVPSRSSLGDNDKGLWELGDDGQPRDPWSFTNELQLMSPDGDLYIYSTSSDGGKRDLGRLCGAYTEGAKQHPGQAPIVTLGRSSYEHKIKIRGKIWVPVLTIVDWTDKGVLAIAALPADGGEDDDIPFDAPLARQAQASMRTQEAVQQANIAKQRDTLAANASAGAQPATVRRGAKF